ncbi:MAG: nucleotide exchange factor GrpE [Chloroherpetonaceae bacterium]|nr:nucleotide exchange factor GrpE [Chloroherpetonaceae bacterium]
MTEDIKTDSVQAENKSELTAANALSENKAERIGEKTESEQFQEKILSLQEERDQFKDSLLRKAAEFENFRRQKEKEVQSVLKYADEGVVKKLLPVIDDLERVIVNADKFLQEKPENKIYVDGVRLVHQKFLKVLEERGIKKIDAVGKPFDTAFHEALMEQVSEAPPESVIQEFEPGYVLHDKVIRHAKVVVAKKAE